MANENEFLLYALLMGIFITFLYDILRIFRRVFRHNGFFVSLEDICFWLYCGGEVFLLMYHESNGTLRWFAVFGALLGMLLYRKLISPWLVKYVSLFLKRAVEMISKIIGRLCSPVRFVCKKAKQGIGYLFRQLARQLKNRLTYFLKMLKMTLKTK